MGAEDAWSEGKIAFPKLRGGAPVPERQLVISVSASALIRAKYVRAELEMEVRRLQSTLRSIGHRYTAEESEERITAALARLEEPEEGPAVFAPFARWERARKARERVHGLPTPRFTARCPCGWKREGARSASEADRWLADHNFAIGQSIVRSGIET